MQGVVRRHIRLQRDLHARRHIQAHHVEFCSECGQSHDRTGSRRTDRCGRCNGNGVRKESP